MKTEYTYRGVTFLVQREMKYNWIYIINGVASELIHSKNVAISEAKRNIDKQLNQTNNTIMAKTMYEGREVETLDLTPTWAGLLPALLAVITDGNNEGRKTAKQELTRMAQAADNFNTLVKQEDHSFTVIAEDGTVSISVGTAQDVIDFTNTLFEYDRRDADEDEITNVWVCVRELLKADFKVQVS